MVNLLGLETKRPPFEGWPKGKGAGDVVRRLSGQAVELPYASPPVGACQGRGPRLYHPQDWRVANGKEFAVLSGCGGLDRSSHKAAERPWRIGCLQGVQVGEHDVDHALGVFQAQTTGVRAFIEGLTMVEKKLVEVIFVLGIRDGTLEEALVDALREHAQRLDGIDLVVVTHVTNEFFVLTFVDLCQALVLQVVVDIFEHGILLG